MITHIAVGIFGAIVYLFLYWRRLKEDYTTGMIFTTAFYSLFALVVFGVLGLSFFSSWWFWFGFLGFTLGLAVGIYRYKLRVYETIEAAYVSLIPWLSLIYLTDAIINSSWYSFVYFVLVVLIGLLYVYLNSKYKEFNWYKSGKVGFAGLATMGVFFLARGVIAIIFPDMISFVEIIDPIISGIVAFSFFLMIFNLSKSSI